MPPTARRTAGMLMIALCTARTAAAQTAPHPPLATEVAQIGEAGNLCEWYRVDDHLDWDVVPPAVANAWERAISAIAAREQVGDVQAERRLVDICRAAAANSTSLNH